MLLLLLPFIQVILCTGVSGSGDYNFITGEETCPDGTICYNHARCLFDSGSYMCLCVVGFNGTNCQNVISCNEITLRNIMLTPNPYRTTYGSIVSYRCLPDHQFLQFNTPNDVEYEKLATCNSQGNWNPPLTDCVARCPPLATWRGYIKEGDGNIAGSVVRYTCWGKYPWYHKMAGEYRYKFKNYEAGSDKEYISRCMDDGSWFPEIQDCVDNNGGNSHLISNGTVYNTYTFFVSVLFIKWKF